MKYLYTVEEQPDGSKNLLLGINISEEELSALKRWAPENEVNPESFKEMDLDQLLTWMRVLYFYCDLWINREKDYAKKAIQDLYQEKQRLQRRSKKRKVRSRRKKSK